jgi:hypothetical protein
MHTSFFKSCVINHNGAYDGDIYISNKGSCEVKLGNLAEIKTTTKDLILLYKNTEKKPKTQTVPGTHKESEDRDITILFKDIEDYVACVLLDKIQEKMDDGDLKMDKMLKIAEILKIKI